MVAFAAIAVIACSYRTASSTEGEIKNTVSLNGVEEGIFRRTEPFECSAPLPQSPQTARD